MRTREATKAAMVITELTAATEEIIEAAIVTLSPQTLTLVFLKVAVVVATLGKPLTHLYLL